MSLSAAEQHADPEVIARRTMEAGLLSEFSPKVLAEAEALQEIDGSAPSGRSA